MQSLCIDTVNPLSEATGIDFPVRLYSGSAMYGIYDVPMG